MEANSLYYAEKLRQLAHGEITPAKIIGTGYKNPRAEAFKYLTAALVRTMLQERLK
jgi:hypothetical protein